MPVRGPWTWKAWLFALGLLVLSVGAAWADEPAPLAARRAEIDHLTAILAPFGRFAATSVTDDGYTFTLDDAHDQRIGELHVGFDKPWLALPRVRSQRYTFSVWNYTPDFRASVDVLIHAANAIVASDGGALTETARRLIDASSEKATLSWATLLMVAVACVTCIARRGQVTLDIRKPHIVQACVHASIFVYWSLYWPGVADQLPMILRMLVLAYGADATFSFLKFGSWRAGFGPFPVVLSTNLFVWLDWRGSVVAIVGAFFCKTYVQREGRHIINPSVAGLSITAIGTVLFPDLIHFTGLFHTLNIAPDMAEWVFLASLVPIAMFRLAPVSIGAILGLHYLTDSPGALRPTLLLMMTLLATDPATTPKTNLGRLFFGVLVGASYPVYSYILRRVFAQPDDFAKILSVPLANVLTPQFDRAASVVRGWAERRGRELRVPHNASMLAAWSALFVVALHGEKPMDFEPSLHWDWGTPLVVRDADGVPRCERNPVFCRPFSFVGEVAGWRTRGRGDPG